MKERLRETDDGDDGNNDDDDDDDDDDDENTCKKHRLFNICQFLIYIYIYI